MKVDFRQFRLIPSGCQRWNSHVIGGDSEGESFAFCSTLAIYIYDCRNFTLQRLIAGGFEQNITAFKWNPHNKNFVVTCSVDGLLLIWDIQKEEPENHIKLPNKPIAIQWSPVNAKEIIIGCAGGRYVRPITLWI